MSRILIMDVLSRKSITLLVKNNGKKSTLVGQEVVDRTSRSEDWDRDKGLGFHVYPFYFL